ncbi:hypothetical protein CCMSSC00406_0004990 [Pleurotus cornucopiae]|uniref:Uncharacterized protein n=1 Tax=Pleurotus cornucopiae TaxID=5321 RepID=A0ACB7J671_PLECO|nr:hypothetical protein CCMSSC00406_0004990 [Pleurotus cornucopiae]
MWDIYDSPAWESLRGFLLSPYHLVFGMYVDWLNPFTNKIAGKVISCGAIVLYCLSLPLAVRFLPENTFIIGMMPGPGMPNVQTISHILISVQKAIGEFDLPGKLLPTFRFPNHTTVAARIIPLIADLQAIRKVAGYASHAANLFCSFCKCVKDDVEDLAHHTWHLRTGAEVHHQAEEWHNAVTVAKKEEIVKKTGVRWTPLHNLPYWNPVSHVMLGYMHNFLEGVLQYQLRSLWGIGRSKSATTQATLHDTEDTVSEAEISESQDELDGLSQEAEEVG